LRRKVYDIINNQLNAERQAGYDSKHYLISLIASAGLLLAASIPLAHDALTDPITVAIAIVSLIILLTTDIDTLWIILASAAVSRSASSFGLIALVA
jgi:hypothetical protein